MFSEEKNGFDFVIKLFNDANWSYNHCTMRSQTLIATINEYDLNCYYFHHDAFPIENYLNNKATLTCILGTSGISSEITMKHAVKTYNENHAAVLVDLARTSPTGETYYVWFDNAEGVPYGTW